MANSTHSESRGRRSAIILVVVIISVVVSVVLIALLWDRMATATVRELDSSEAQTDTAPEGSPPASDDARWT